MVVLAWWCVLRGIVGCVGDSDNWGRGVNTIHTAVPIYNLVGTYSGKGDGGGCVMRY